MCNDFCKIGYGSPETGMYFCRNKNNPFMLKKARLAAAIIFWGIITLLFLDFTGTLHAWFGWMARIQFLPAVLALNLGVVILLVALTLVFGRVYCSVIKTIRSSRLYG